MTEQAKLLEKLSKISAATLHEAIGKQGALPYGIKPINPTMKLCGRAFTVSSIPGDNKMLHRAIANASAGDVIVAHVSNYYEAGYWGELMTVGAIQRGILGLVIDGCVRDADPIEQLGFPIFSRGLCIHGTTKFGQGTLKEPITIGDVIIHTGDIVVGDRDGVVVIPATRAEEALEKGIAREEKEARTLEQLRAGKTSLEIYGWD